MTDSFSVNCPIPVSSSDTIQMAHGGGGRLMNNLIEQVFRKAFDNSMLHEQHDGAVFEMTGRCAMTTDSYVVSPLFFPGGDIGRLAVTGTANDLAMCGAVPRYISAGFILEEGLPMSVLMEVVDSMAKTAAGLNVRVVTGDLKVVENGKADGIYINTCGIGELIVENTIAPSAVKISDVIIISGDIGRHGIAVMSARDELGLENIPDSDCGPLIDPVMALLEEGIRVNCLRDLTRGGLSSALVEIAETSGFTFTINEDSIPISNEVRATCELLGLDPMYVANEGRFIAILNQADAERALQVLGQYEIT
ncbi:MAG: hydrogenase expression/formation protein HypE, partial [Gammaproteobacteria bacterium]|nr:hydrogenase expression/formation protein HypE [Gammaproteobacteria bacterium]